MISSATPRSAQNRAFRSSGNAPMSFKISTRPSSKTRSTTSGRHVFAESTGGQTCASSRGSIPPQTSSHRSRNPRNRRTSSSTSTAPRFVRALSAPTSITSAPARTCSRANPTATSKSKVPSPENESSFTFTIPITKGRRGNSITRSGNRNRMPVLNPKSNPM